ncbi:MAG: hypothetical protein ABMA13_01100 [Chthoniobacteraceae bacterium]
MTQFTQVSRDPLADMMKRHALMSQPDEFFMGLFGGRRPTLDQRMLFVEQAVQRMNSQQTWENDLYIVDVLSEPPFLHLDIRRKDGEPCKNWRHFQRIKNELIGPEHEAVELFPAESRLVDTANQYHLWVRADPHYRFPFGLTERLVLSEPIRLEPGSAGALSANTPEALPMDSLVARERQQA